MAPAERLPPERRTNGGVRVLVVSVDVGESHAAMAGALAADLERRQDVRSVEVCSGFGMLGPVLGAVLPRGFEFHLGRVQWSYDLAYRLFSRVPAARRAGELALYVLGGAGLERTIERHMPDVVVSTYPVLNPILSRLRMAGRLRCPVAAVVGPAGGLSFWVQPGIDLHLMLYAEAVPEARRLAGDIRWRAVRPLIAPGFLLATEPSQARAELEARLPATLPAGRRLVVVSGGGWGAGDLAGAVRACLAIPDTDVIAVCGRNDAARRRLQNTFGHNARVTVLGFTDLMPLLLGAADAFVTATAGISCLEARVAGCPTICYGFAFGHVRDNTRALVAAGLARTAATPADLEHEIGSALAAGRVQSAGWQRLPTAAEVTVELARNGGPAGLAAPDRAWQAAVSC